MIGNHGLNPIGDDMKHLACIALFGIAILASLATIPAAGEKPTPWRPFIPVDSYANLTKRSIQTIETKAASGDKNAEARIEVEAILLAGYSLNTAAKNGLADYRAAARYAADMARSGKSKELVMFSQRVGKIKAVGDTSDVTKYTKGTDLMMKLMFSKAKGGEGIHPDLQYLPKLKNLNGIEALLGALANKKLSDENLAKVSKELPPLAYRVAVIGALTHEFTPKKDVEKWRDYSLTMRDASVALAEASAKKDAEGILKSALAIESSCIDCHSVFKNK